MPVRSRPNEDSAVITIAARSRPSQMRSRNASGDCAANCLVEVLNDGRADSQGVEASELFRGICQQRWRTATQDLCGMGFEGEHDRLGLVSLRDADECAQRTLMAAMQAVEHADRQREAHPLGHLIDAAQNPHERTLPGADEDLLGLDLAAVGASDRDEAPVLVPDAHQALIGRLA